MKIRLLAALLATGLTATAFAEVRKDYPSIAFLTPSAGTSTVSRDQFLVLVIEGPFISHDKTPIASDATIGYVNSAMKAKGASYLAVHIREGVKYGDVVRALDVLSQTATKSIGVSMAELPAGRDL